jgi:hypothetical protein
MKDLSEYTLKLRLKLNLKMTFLHIKWNGWNTALSSEPRSPNALSGDIYTYLEQSGYSKITFLLDCWVGSE